MATFPGAISKRITASKGRQQLTLYNRVNLHVAASEEASLHGYFNQTGRPDSHFYIRRDGTVEQYVDTTWRAISDVEGNDATVSIETQGGVTDADNEPWTPAQLESIAQIYVWAIRTHGLAHKLATSSHADERSHGLSWHRLGIDGNFPELPDIRAGRLQRGGGMSYSSAGGKICPGGGKILQIPGILERATQILGAAPVEPTPDPDPTPTDPTPNPDPTPVDPDLPDFEENDMPYILVRPDSAWYLVTGRSAAQIGRDTAQGSGTGLDALTIIRIRDEGTWTRIGRTIDIVNA